MRTRPPTVAAVVLGLALVAACAPGGAPTTLRANRAYDGAPPVIPHDVRELGRGNCQACHTTGEAMWEGKRAPRTPHPELQRCTQCHLEHVTDELFAANDFEGRAYARGTRQQPSGPWLIPHPLTMREDCLDCHLGDAVVARGEADPDARAADTLPDDFAGPPTTTHPERSRCTQCHLPAHADWPGPRPGLHPGADR